MATGNDLFGEAGYEIYSTTERDLTSNEQLAADLQMSNTFIKNNRDSVEIAYIRLMPYTTLTNSEWNRIKDLMEIKNSGDAFNRFLDEGIASLSD